MLKAVAIAAVALGVSGCASMVGGLVNRPVAENSIAGAVSTVSLASDRRTVIVVTDGTNRSKFCAEPPPDTATALKTDLDSNIKAQGKSETTGVNVQGEASNKDKFETTVQKLAERTVPLDAFRTGVYSLCQLHLNGALSKEEVRPLFEKLIDVFATGQADANKRASR